MKQTRVKMDMMGDQELPTRAFDSVNGDHPSCRAYRAYRACHVCRACRRDGRRRHRRDVRAVDGCRRTRGAKLQSRGGSRRARRRHG